MTKEQIIKLVSYYRDHLALLTFEVERKPSGVSVFSKNPMPIGEPTRWEYDRHEDGEMVIPGRESQLQHARWMTTEILNLLASESEKTLEKVFRWLGFLQGILWATGIFTINEMRAHNRSEPTDA
jgi:hypothetical protein